MIYRDSERLAEHDLARGVLGLGRHPENDIVLDDRTLSRFHAKIVRQGLGDSARWMVVDLGAQNGVHLNGERIAAEVELHPGDRIELGRYTAVFEAPAPARPKSAAARPTAAPAPLPGAGIKATAPPAVGKPPSAKPALAAPPVKAPARPSAADELDLDEDLRMDDELAVEVDAEFKIDELGELELPTNKEPGTKANSPSAQEATTRGPANVPAFATTKAATQARDDGLTAELHDLLDDEQDREQDDVSHAAYVPPQPTFVLLLNGLEVSRHPLTSAELTIGRSKQCDIVISLLGLSRRHARIWPADEGVLVEDLGSQNGTWVNNVRINGPHVLKHGDLLNFYDYGVLFLEDGEVDVGFPGAEFAPPAPGAPEGSRDDRSPRETDRGSALPTAKPAPAAGAPAKGSPAKAPLTTTARAPAAGPAKASPPATPAKSGAPSPAAAKATVVETPRRAADDDDDLGLGARASEVPEATDFGRPRPPGKAAAEADRFDPDALGDGSFLGDEFDDSAAKEAPRAERPAAGLELSQIGDEGSLEAELAFSSSAKLSAGDEFADLPANGDVRELGDSTMASLEIDAIPGGVWPSDADLDRALAQTNDVAAVTIDVTVKGRSHAQIPLSQPVTRVGTDPRCECALAKASGLRPWHLTFLQMGGAVVVTRANRSARIEVGGRAVDTATLRNGDVIQVGDVQMKLRFRR